MRKERGGLKEECCGWENGGGKGEIRGNVQV